MNKVTGRQIAAARALLRMTQAELAGRANVSVPTLKRIESSPGVAVGLINNVTAICRVLNEEGIIFIWSDEADGVKVRKNGEVESRPERYWKKTV